MRLRRFAVAGILSGTLTVCAPAQDQLLKQQERLQAVAIQRVEAGVREALLEAQRLAQAGSKTRAAERLRSALRLLDDPILPRSNTDAWRAQLQRALQAVETGQAPPVPDPATIANAKDAEVKRLQAMVAEEREIRRGLETVSALVRSGDHAQARKEIEALSQKYPSHPTVLVLPNLLNRTMTLDEVREVHLRQIENIRLALLDLQKSGTIAKFDYELPPDWKEKTERRKPRLSPQLAAVLAALKTPIEIDRANAPLSEILKTISAAIKQPIVLDKQTMTDAGIDSSTPTTVQTGTTVSARTALRMALAVHGLTYVIKDNTIHVVTREKAASMMETRVYYIGDLVTPISSGFIGIPGRASLPYVDPDQLRQNVENLIRQIKESVDPGSWKGGGSDGRGEIIFHAPSMALIIKNSAEVHGLMANTLK